MAEEIIHWYEKSWITILLLILFFPIGLFLMWQYRSWNKWLKISLTSVGLLVVLLSWLLPDRFMLESVTLPSTTFQMEVESNHILKPSYYPKYGKQTLVYKSDNEKIAKFDGDNLIAVAEGKTCVYVESKDGRIVSNKMPIKVVDTDLDKKRSAAQKVIEKINAIGEVSIDSRTAISEAQKAYDTLSIGEKDLVTNIGTLQLAQTTLEEKEKQAILQNKEASEKAAAKGNTQTTEPVKDVSSEKSETVYVGKTGSKYHRKDCSTLRGKGTPMNRQDAIQAGKQPCKRCNP